MSKIHNRRSIQIYLSQEDAQIWDEVEEMNKTGFNMRCLMLILLRAHHEKLKELGDYVVPEVALT